ncbi:MAG: hypothetical protein HEP71_09045 [Roseivirga sp.]|nr:hypothetical protein [Roseivirga sp.]
MRYRLPVILLAMMSLIVGLLTGFLRIGWTLPVYGLSGNHGAIMVGGFLGSLITLERAIVLKSNWAYAIPLTSGLSMIAFFIGQDQWAHVLLIAASAGLIVIYLVAINQKKGVYIEYLLVGAICWLAGNILLLRTGFYPSVFPWWMIFVLSTIVGERLELTRFLPVTKFQKQLLGIFQLVALAGIMLPFHGPGRWMTGAGLLAIALWLMKFDVVRVLLKKQGHFFYTGLALFSGYCWLLMVGALVLINPATGYAYDALLHTFFLGFTFSMIFAHGPIIFPGILGQTVQPFHKLLFVWLGLLNVSIIGRVLADFGLWMEMRMWSGMLSGVSIIFFLITLMVVLQKQRYLS